MRLLACLLLAGLSGCATTSTIVTDRGTLEATIHGGDEEALLVTNEVGVKRRVRREDVLEIDHPGNVTATVLGITGGVFAIELTAFAASGLCGTSPTGTGVAPCITFGSLSIVSLGLFAYGLWTWISSRNAVFNPPAPSEGEMTKVPFAFPNAAPEPPVVVPPPPPLGQPAL